MAARSSSLVLLPLLVLACADPDDASDSATSGDTSTSTEGSEDPDDPDSDADGLSDAEEAELGTDPLDKDSDDDNYWDGWEVLEGTDPLDQSSRIYTGWWPYNPDKDALDPGSWDAASTALGSRFPRHTFFDRFGEAVDIYDFANFTYNAEGEPAPIVIDISTVWCPPCHNLAAWLGGVENDDTASLQAAYPSVPDKVHGLRVWWLTFLVEGGTENDPVELSDAELWFSVHPEPYIPVFADLDQLTLTHYLNGAFPTLFVLDPELGVVHYEQSNNIGSALAYIEGL